MCTGLFPATNQSSFTANACRSRERIFFDKEGLHEIYSQSMDIPNEPGVTVIIDGKEIHNITGIYDFNRTIDAKNKTKWRWACISVYVISRSTEDINPSAALLSGTMVSRRMRQGLSIFHPCSRRINPHLRTIQQNKIFWI